jgi:hypothetical protein
VDGLLDLHCAERNSENEKPQITLHSNVPIQVEIHWAGGVETIG